MEINERNSFVQKGLGNDCVVVIKEDLVKRKGGWRNLLKKDEKGFTIGDERKLNGNGGWTRKKEWEP